MTTTTPETKPARAPRKTAAQKAAEQAEVEQLTAELIEVWGAYRPAEFSEDQMLQLMSDLNPARVSQRTGGGGSKLSYLEAHDVKATLIRIFGFANFSSELVSYKVENVRQWEVNNKAKVQVTVSAHVKLTIHQTGAVYSEAAASSQTGSDVGEVMDFALKTAESDAFKRCAVFLGTQFGASLYAQGATADQVRVVLEAAQAKLLSEGRKNRATPPPQQQLAQAPLPPEQPQEPQQQPQQGQRPPQQQRPQQGQQRPPQQPPVDDRPMAMADYSQGDPNAHDGLTPPQGGMGAVAGAFNHSRGTGAVPPPISDAEHYTGETYGDR